jgi:hypothetical protein
MSGAQILGQWAGGFAWQICLATWERTQEDVNESIKDGREWLRDLQRYGDHKQKETLHGFPLANSLHILSLLGITALNGLSSTSSFCL